jgi:simple sugar transport system permease protein
MKKLKLENLAVPVAGLAIALVLSAVMLLAIGTNPVIAFRSLLQGAFGSVNTVSSTILKTIPLLLCGLAVVISYRSGIFNIGAESQLYFGAIGGAMVAVHPAFQNMPPAVTILCALLLGALFGAALGALPGFLKAYRHVNEVVVTMLLNYIAAYILTGLVGVGGPLHETGTIYNRSNAIWPSAELPELPFLRKVHIGLIIAVVAAVLMWYVFKHTVTGFRMTSVGLNPKAAEYAGMNNRLILTNVMAISGAIAGLAGAIEVLGYHHRLQENFSVGIGYTAIAVAQLANLNPLGVILSAVFFSALTIGANTMQSVTKIPTAFSTIIQGLIIFCVIASTMLPNTIKKHKERKQCGRKASING